MQTLLSGQLIERYKLFNEFVKQNVIPHVEEWDSQESIPSSIIKMMGEKGYLGSIVPKKYEGQSMDYVLFGLLNEAFGRGSSSLTDLITVQTMTEITLLKWGSEPLRQHWLPPLAKGELIGAYAMTEPSTGSDLTSMKTTFSRKHEKYIVNGVKKWISFAELADVFIVFGKLNELPTTCLVPRSSPGVSVKPIKNMMGFRAGHLGEVSFNEVEIPEENIIGKPGFALSYIAPYGLHYGRMSTACSAWGLMRACLEESTAYVADRQVGGVKLQEKGMIREIIAKMGVNVEAATQLCINACKAEDMHSPEAMDKTLIAKYFTSKAVVHAASDAVQIKGASGCHEGSPVARYYRDAKIMEIIEGTSQVHLDILGKRFIEKRQPCQVPVI